MPSIEETIDRLNEANRVYGDLDLQHTALRKGVGNIDIRWNNVGLNTHSGLLPPDHELRHTICTLLTARCVKRIAEVRADIIELAKSLSADSDD